MRVLVDGVRLQAVQAGARRCSRTSPRRRRIVVNDVLPPARLGHSHALRSTRASTSSARADHRKLYVIDGAVAWTGGAGIEDHFRDGRFHDVMTRVTGDVVRQAQAAFLTSFHAHGGTLPADLSPCFPEPDDPGVDPVALAQVIPGGFAAATQAIREQIDGARERLDVMNPYLTDHDMIERILAAARRGAKVRLVVSETLEQRPGHGRAQAPLRRPARGRRGAARGARHGRPRQGRGRRRRGQLRHGQPRRVVAATATRRS